MTSLVYDAARPGGATLPGRSPMTRCLMIEVVCACGKISTVEDRHAGKRGRCGACGAPNVVPIPGLLDLFESLGLGNGSVEVAAVEPAPTPWIEPEPEPEPEPAPVEEPEPEPAPIADDPFMAIDLPSSQPEPAALVLEVRCNCGKMCRFDPKDAGMMGRCPSCQMMVSVPRWPYLPGVQRVDVIDADIPFWSMCWLVLKWSLATIPTAILYAILYALWRVFADAARR